MAGLLKFLSDIGFLTVGNDEKEVAVEATMMTTSISDGRDPMRTLQNRYRA